jgi:hypothetical protein
MLLNKVYLSCNINDNTNANRGAWAVHVACTVEKMHTEFKWESREGKGLLGRPVCR